MDLSGANAAVFKELALLELAPVEILELVTKLRAELAKRPAARRRT